MHYNESNNSAASGTKPTGKQRKQAQEFSSLKHSNIEIHKHELNFNPSWNRKPFCLLKVVNALFIYHFLHLAC